ncbi:MAG: hypothetical protein NT150_10755 [Bacteroidetes bacterium]|nr:hypothetical protein [Bacteroidota bacterium]
MRQLLSILSICLLFVGNSLAQNTARGNFIVGLSASKDSYFSTLFQQASTFEFPINMELMVTNDFSIGLKGSPVIINNTSNSYLTSGNTGKKNDNSGYLLIGMGNLNYYAYNEYRLLWKITGEAGYVKMDKIKYTEDDRSEIKAEGMTYRIGTSLRYHLGNEYNDVFPTFFELGIGTSRMMMKVKESTFKGDPLPSIHSSWNPLNFSTLDVALTFGYRFGKSK